MTRNLICLSLLIALPVLAQDQGKQTARSGPARLPVEQTLISPTLFNEPLESIREAYVVELTEAQKKRLERSRERMAKEGVELPPFEPGIFQWLSGAKDGLRAAPGNLSMFGESIGEVVIRAGVPGKAGSATISIYNRGDDGEITLSELANRMEAWKGHISGALKSKPESRDQRGTLSLTGWMWRQNGAAWLLESSSSKTGNISRAEFLRIRIAPLDGGSGGQVARRSGLTQHVVKKDNGDVYLEGIPMVDQGEKGYCAVATTERVVRYYGLDVDQHEMASIANTGTMGTSMEEMEEALKRATGKLSVKTTKQFELEFRQFQQDVRTYNQIAKRQGEKEFIYERKVAIVSPLSFWAQVKPEIFLKMKTEQTGFERFNAKIAENIDQGIPVCWALQLGMFKETGIPQTRGGHMRLIIGYNKKTGELLYSDSWGKGHELKRMPSGHAWCMTMALFTMVPTR
jgi:hypothetical protein